MARCADRGGLQGGRVRGEESSRGVVADIHTVDLAAGADALADGGAGVNPVSGLDDRSDSRCSICQVKMTC